jgi:streptogramin lyase
MDSSHTLGFAVGGRSQPQYVFITKWGTPSIANGLFNHPEDITIDKLGHIYVVDSRNECIEKFDSYNKFITALGSPVTSNGLFSEVTDVTVVCFRLWQQ